MPTASPPGAVDRPFDGLVVLSGFMPPIPTRTALAVPTVQRPPSAMTGEPARVRWPEGGVGRGLAGLLPGVPGAAVLRLSALLALAPDGGEEPRYVKHMITAAPGRVSAA